MIAKFRFWTGKKMINATEFSDVFIKGDGNLYCCHDLGTDIKYIHDSFSQANDFKAMQCTGIKDSNGKEIYQGDIVYDSSCDIKYEVVFYYGNGWCSKDGQYCLTPDMSDVFTIVGNIYEK